MKTKTRAEYIKARFGRSQCFVNWREQQIVAGMLELIERPLHQILDIPCGHGRFTPRLRPAATQRLLCGDIAGERLKALLDAEPEEGPTLEIIEVDLLKPLPFETYEFDLVFDIRFFQHLIEKDLRELLIVELARIAKRYVIISFYEASAIHSWQKRIWRRTGHITTMVMLARAEFFSAFERQGLEVMTHKAILPGIHAQRIVLFEKGQATQ